MEMIGVTIFVFGWDLILLWLRIARAGIGQILLARTWAFFLFLVGRYNGAIAGEIVRL